MRREWIVIILLFLDTSFATPSQTKERDNERESFGVSPLDITLEASTGQSVSGSFRIVTETKTPRRYSITIYDSTQDSQGNVLAVPVGQGTRSFAPWISIPEEVTIDPNGREEVPFTIRCPASARGDYFASIAIKLLQPPSPQAGMFIGFEPAISVSVSLRVPSVAPLHIDVTDLSLEPGKAGRMPAAVITAENTGVWKSTVEGDVLFYGAPGSWPIRASIPSKQDGNPAEIYPGMSVDFRCNLTHALPPGEYTALVRVLMAGNNQARNRFKLVVPEDGGDRLAGGLLEKSEFDVNLLVEPAFVELDTPPGAHRTVPVKLHNQGDREVDISIDITDVKIETDGMLTFLEGGETNTESWVSASPEHLRLSPQRREVVRVEVNVPRQGSERTTLLKAVRIQASSVVRESTDDWSSAGVYSTLIVAEDPKAPPPALETAGFDVIRAATDMNPTAVVWRVKNAGSKVARAFGKIQISRGNGQEIGNMDLGGTESELILPGMEREFRMPIPTLDKGDFKIVADLTPGDKGGQPAHAETNFTTNTAIPEGLERP